MNAGDLAGLVWQSSLLLAFGLLASRLLRRHPARAHLVLLLAIGASVCAPLLSSVVRRNGWGALPGPELRSPASVGRLERAVAEPPRLSPPLPIHITSGTGRTATAQPTAETPRVTQPARPETSRWTSPSILVALPVIALLASLVAGMRLLRAWLDGWAMVSRAHRETSGPLVEALVRAAARIGLRSVPALAVSNDVTCPMLWPWTRGGLLLVPTGAAVRGRVDWDAVLAHELAHLRRADHRGLLAGHGLVVLMPWQPLAWWCRRRLLRLAELACDDWVVASGHARAEYADSLLAFMPAARRGWAMAAVSNGGTLRQRIERILGGRLAAPAPGRVWVGATIAVSALLVGGLACAQPGPARTIPAQDSQPAVQPPAKSGTAAGHGTTVTGTVIDEQGRPVAGAEVRAASVAHGEFTPVRTTRTDARGEFIFQELGPGLNWSFSADDPRYARQWIGEVFRKLDQGEAEPLVLTLVAPVQLAGVVRNEDGQPVIGARVILTREYPANSSESLYGSDALDLAVTRTDETGAFRLDRLRPGAVRLLLDHPDYVQTLTSRDEPLATGREDIELVMPRGRTLRGRVTSGGRPLEGTTVKGSGSAFRRARSAVTDSGGAFELRGISLPGKGARRHRSIELLALSIDDPLWWSPKYLVYDEGKLELPFVEIEVEPRSADDIDVAMFVNPPTNGDEARDSGEPVGNATVEVTLTAPPKDRFRRFREVWIDGTALDSLAVHRRAPVNREGIVVFDQLPAGKYTLWLPGTEPPAIPSVAIELAEDESRRVSLDPGPARVHGTVSCGGTPVTQGSIVVDVFDPGTSDLKLQAAGVVHPDGTWEATGLPLGRYQVTYEGDHSVPNRFWVDGTSTETLLDLELPQTRIDVVLHGRDYKPAEYDGLDSHTDETVFFDIRAFPGGTMPQGGNTGGHISIADGQPYVEHLPPGRWTLFTGSGAGAHEGRLIARVRLESDTSRVTADLWPSDGGTGVIRGTLAGLDTTRLAGEAQPLWICAFAKDDAGLDTSVWFGAARSSGTTYEISGLPAGRYGVLIGPSLSIKRVAHGDVDPLPWMYLPDLVVGDGETLVRDVVVPAMRTVVLDSTDSEGHLRMATWRIDLGGGDWLPFNLFIGSSPQANIAGPGPFGLPVGEHRLELTFNGEQPGTRSIHVESGSGVQRIALAPLEPR